jgi:hypothetical protein
METPRIGDSIEGQCAAASRCRCRWHRGPSTMAAACSTSLIGGTGRFTSPCRRVDRKRRFRCATSCAAVSMPCARRSALRIAAVIDGPLGSFADALITGERARIPRAMNDSLQASGLFHILSISGLHMAMVAGSAFWLVRALLALSSTTLALRYPIKKWAAGVALADRRVLHVARRWRCRNGALLHHDRRDVLRRDGGPSGDLAAQSRRWRRC